MPTNLPPDPVDGKLGLGVHWLWLLAAMLLAAAVGRGC